MRDKFNFQTARFHVEYGPASLFERVEYKMKDVHQLRMEGKHFQDRLKERGITEDIISKIDAFDTKEWKLKTVEVRTDKGKFVDSTWEVSVNGKAYWVTIGLGNFVKTIVIKSSSGMDKCVQKGELYDYVEEVNRDLMNQDKTSDYSYQAKETWGETNAYKEYEQRSKTRTKDDERILGEKMMEIFVDLGKVKDTDPTSDEVQALVKRLQTYITDNFYTCTDEIFLSLGQMYRSGGDMTRNIDKVGGEGTAEFTAKAIEVYCREL